MSVISLIRKFSWILAGVLYFQAGAQQIQIDRIEMMPDFPQPYEMRDWRSVAQKYDSLVFDLDASGQYLPLTTIIQNTVNYPDHPTLGIQSYVGTNSPPGREAINILPAVVSASLAGIDKSDQFGYNWVLMCEEFFNKRPEENVYLNGPVASSGNDWWYETMPNVFFYQLNYLYPGTGEFNYQFETVADRWFAAVQAMGGQEAPWQEAYMNYRAFSLSTMTPLDAGVPEPEAAGAIAWILYNAYHETADPAYRKGAEWSMEFLDGWETNPSYELQMPYGAYAAARMNAELGTLYDVEKMVNWCFDVGPLRQWGAIVESWGGLDVHGLIGEARVEFPGYAFNMNGTEQAAALVPMVRYDDRFARAIGKWTLNVANATRYFYSQFLPDGMQDNEDWTQTYDPHSVIAYEALREYVQGPYGTGDAVQGGWASTNLGLYGSSHVGILGALIDTTNVPGILQLDLLATDYYHGDAYPSFLFYNPYDEEKTFMASFPENTSDLYDAVSNQVIATGITGDTEITLSADRPMVAVMIPAGSTIDHELNKALVDGIVIDYHSGNPVDNFPPRIKGIAASDTVFQVNLEIDLYCTAEDKETDTLTYTWELNGALAGNEPHITVLAPSLPGTQVYICTVEDEGGKQSVDSVTVEIVEFINYPPEIHSLSAHRRYVELNDTTTILCLATDLNQDPLTFTWSADGGTLDPDNNVAVYTAPAQQGIYEVLCTVEDTSGASASRALTLLVRDPALVQDGDLVADYEFNGNVLDKSGNGHHGTPTNIVYSEDFRSNPAEALSLPFSTSKVVIGNSDMLNFREGITLTGWIYIDRFFDRESYPVSHGNWNNRWKLSLTGEKLRFTVNGENGIIDVDSETSLEVNNWYHIAAVYDGAFCQIYLDGRLDGFRSFSGLIHPAAYDLVFGQSLPDQQGYDFEGKLDKIKLYNYGMTLEGIRQIYENELFSVPESFAREMQMKVFPNPAGDRIHVSVVSNRKIMAELHLLSVDGTLVHHQNARITGQGADQFLIPVKHLPQGVYLLVLKGSRYHVSTKVTVQR